MVSVIKVDKITGQSGKRGSAPISLSGDTATLGSGVTFPNKVRDLTCWYPAIHQNGTWTSYDSYPVTSGFQNTNARFSGVVPNGFTSLVSAEFICFNSSNQTVSLAMHYLISRNGSPHNEHEGGLVNIPTATSKSFTANQMEYLNLLDGAHSPKFEDTIAEGDIFGIRINCGNQGTMYALGAKFVWRI